MTKDVELHSSTWKTMKQAITGLTENATVSSSGYGNYTNAQAGSYSTGTTSTGFAKRVEDLVKISEKVQKLIKEKDTDGVVSYTYHDETSTAQTLQAKLSTLERYAENVNTYINKKIDRPFYEAMDKVGAKLEALNIQKYKTTNKIGYKRIEPVKDPYGHPVGTKEVTPPEIGIDELYKVDSPYKASLKKSYEEYRKSKDYKDSRLTETEYVQVIHQTRSFEYVSIDDEKSTTEMWRDLTLLGATVVLFVFCPPAGAVLSTVAATGEMYSAASGKDWGTGRELDGNERVMRGAFALLDLIPAGKYLSGLAKTGKTAGLAAVKTSIKTAVKEGIEQGAKNFDTFKGLLKKTKGLGDNIYHSLPTYRKQLARHLQNTVDEGLLNLSKAAQEGLERAKQFTLEVPTVVVRETSTGSQMMRFEKMSKSLPSVIGGGNSLNNIHSNENNSSVDAPTSTNPEKSLLSSAKKRVVLPQNLENKTNDSSDVATPVQSKSESTAPVSPFISNVEVEKRPLGTPAAATDDANDGGAATAKNDDHKKSLANYTPRKLDVSEDDPDDEVEPGGDVGLPPEFSADVMAAEEADVSSLDAAVDDIKAAEQRASKKPSDNDDVSPRHLSKKDSTEPEPKPMFDAASRTSKNFDPKEESKSGWLTVLLILLFLAIGVAGGAAAYFLLIK